LRAVKRRGAEYDRQDFSYDDDLLEQIFKLSYTVKTSYGEGSEDRRGAPTYIFPLRFVFVVNLLLTSFFKEDGEVASVIYISERESESIGTMWENDPIPEIRLKKRRTLRQK
jgi:hypothetical protein